MFEPILLIVASTTIYLVYFRVVPMVCHEIALNMARTARGKIYIESDKNNALYSSLIYMDVEYLLCNGIRRIETGSVWDRLEFLVALAPAKNGSKQADSWRRERYDEERRTLYASGDGKAALDALGNAFMSLCMATVVSLPLFMLLCGPVLIALYIRDAFKPRDAVKALELAPQRLVKPTMFGRFALAVAR